MKKLICNGVPVFIGGAVCVCLAVGVNAVYTTVLVAVMAAAVLALNPFGLLDVVLATKSRFCLAVGLMMVLAAFVQPFGWKVSVFLVLSGFVLLYFGLRFNGRMFDEQQKPMNSMKLDFMHSRFVDETISAMNADPKNLGESRRYWKDRGIREFRSLMHLSGILATEEEIDRIAERAFCFGRSTVHKANGNVSYLQSKISSMENDRELLIRRIQELERYEKEYQEFIHDDFGNWFHWSREKYHAQQANDSYEPYEEPYPPHYNEPTPEREAQYEPIPISPPVGEVTGDMILRLLRGGMTQQEICETYGIPRSTYYYRKKQAEKRSR